LPVRRADADWEPGGEAGIVERIAAGDEQAFAMAYDRYADLIFGSVVRFSGDRETAAEVVQDAFLTLWRKARKFDRRSGSLLGWLLRVARNRAIDMHRAQSRRPVSVAPLADAVLPPDASVRDPAVLDPAAIADQHWLQALVRTYVSELPDEERDVLLLAYANGLSQSEISGRTGLPLGTVKSRTRRAMAHLRDRLEHVTELGRAER
jgi:RNA polymerase sigma-70 factor (ECF subfamily)